MGDDNYAEYAKWKGWLDVQFGAVSNGHDAYYSLQLKELRLQNLTGKRIVEIGFGNGEFAAWAISRGARYAGTEIQSKLVVAAEKIGIEAYSGELPLDSIFEVGSIDCIVAFDVFEHFAIEELTDLLLQCKRVLKNEGVIVGRIPSGDSPFSGAIQRGDITHQVALGSSALQQLAYKVGLEVDQIREPAFPLNSGGFYSLIRRSWVVLLRNAFFAFIRHIIMGNGNAILTPNLVFSMMKKCSPESADDE